MRSVIPTLVAIAKVPLTRCGALRCYSASAKSILTGSVSARRMARDSATRGSGSSAISLSVSDIDRLVRCLGAPAINAAGYRTEPPVVSLPLLRAPPLAMHIAESSDVHHMSVCIYQPPRTTPEQIRRGAFGISARRRSLRLLWRGRRICRHGVQLQTRDWSRIEQRGEFGMLFARLINRQTRICSSPDEAGRFWRAQQPVFLAIAQHAHPVST